LLQASFPQEADVDLLLPLRLNAHVLKVLAETRFMRVTHAARSPTELAVAATGGRTCLTGKNPNCQSSTCSVLSSPLIELPLIIYGRGAKRNERLS
jgi:hypothetical protein